MAGDVHDRVAAHEGPGEASERAVLRRGVASRVRPFQLDADREVVAPGAAAPRRFAGVPRPPRAAYELHEPAVAPNEKMRGDAEVGDWPERRMCARIEAVGEEALDRVTAEVAGRK